MMNNIFNQFDPSQHLTNPFLIPFLTTMLINTNLTKASLTLTNKTILLTNFMKENKNNMMNNNKKMSNMMISNILISTSIINILALNIYNWSNTSHIANNMNIILLSWTPILLMIMINKKKNFMPHLNPPQNTPMMLIPFMFLIELISFMIRPITLLMRLTANMIAGHIMMILNSNMILNSQMIIMFPSLSMILLTLMETIVAILQAYIIMTLISMFISEI
uniref:ATP synthase subunit a n=1 Tax=Demodex brevis TaxID=574145 RepID=A0A0A7DUA6_DEMBR|nr:ATP synthase F0 subunit 6 [Demodex brevis]